MEPEKSYGGLDIFRMAAALLVVAIHTSPLACVSAGADFFLTRVLARLAVPFFFLVTGQFVLGGYLENPKRGRAPIRRCLAKTLALYGIAVLLYLPVGVYAGHYENLTVFSFLRMVVFEGTFYHLWYFPALLLGILLLCLLRRFCPPRALAAIVAALYLAGMLGDSYWGAIRGIPGLSGVYEAGFQVFTYTRNGLFFAPLFLFMGARVTRPAKRANPSLLCAGLAVSFLLMTAEAFLLRRLALPRHDSMYLFLPACMYFLYRLLLLWRRPPAPFLRSCSTWVYLLHPAMIVAVRGAAKVLHATDLLVSQSMLHYLAVSLLSVGASAVLAAVRAWRGETPFAMDRAWIELSRAALSHNVRVLRSLLPPQCLLMPAVKANAYGHGAVFIARELSRVGVKAFCVACVSEGVELRRGGVKGDILVLGYTHPRQFPLLRRYRLIQTVIDAPYAEQLGQYGKKLRVHIGVDTGMHRLGVPSGQIDAICHMFSIKGLQIEGMFTHLCADDSAETGHQEFTLKQARAFYQLADELARRGLPRLRLHLISSYGILNYPGLGGDYARAGIALYGVPSTRDSLNRCRPPLRPVLSLKARVACVKALLPGESAGYGLCFTAERPTRLAVLAIGYADGLPRALSCGAGSALLDGHRVPIVGRVCMDQVLVDVTGLTGVRTGDIAVLIGTSGNETIHACELAEQAQTIVNELLSGLGARLRRFVV